MRTIAICFAVIVLTVPLAARGSWWSLLLLLDIALAAVALREALRLRRAEHDHT